MVQAVIGRAGGIDGAVPRPNALTALWYGLGRMAAGIQAEAELSCIDERLREDAGLTPGSYRDAARDRFRG